MFAFQANQTEIPCKGMMIQPRASPWDKRSNHNTRPVRAKGLNPGHRHGEEQTVRLSVMTRESHNFHAFITGASGGLGREIAVALAQPDSLIGIHYARDEEKASETASRAAERKATPYLVHADFQDKAAVDCITSQVKARNIKLHVLVLNAGAVAENPVVKISENEWDKLIEINYRTPVRLLDSLAESCLVEGCHVIITGSLAGLTGRAGLAAYAASKGALLGFVRDAARKFAKRNILINAILPGWLKTEMTQGLSDVMFDRFIAENCLGRPTTCKEVALFVSYLTKLENVSGQVFALDSRPATV